MAYENKRLQIPPTGENTQVEETNLQIEELEPRVAPDGRPAPTPWPPCN